MVLMVGCGVVAVAVSAAAAVMTLPTIHRDKLLEEETNPLDYLSSVKR